MKKGFTLIELLAVIIILAVVSIIATPMVLDVVEDSKNSAKDSKLKMYADSVKIKATEKYFTNNGNLNGIVDTTNLNNKGTSCASAYYLNDRIYLGNCTVDNDNGYYYMDGIITKDSTSYDEIINNYENNETYIRYVANDGDDSGDGSLERPYATIPKAYEKLPSIGGTISLLTDIETEPMNFKDANKHIILTSYSGNKTIKLKSLAYEIIVAGNNPSNMTLTLGDITIDCNNLAKAIYVQSGSSLIMNAGTVIKNGNNTKNEAAGAIDVGGTFTMNDGLITNNVSSGYGGGVSVANGAKFDMKGGTISNNSATTYGGGVAGLTGATIDLIGGTISDNKALQSGGGAFLQGTVANILGSTITRNDIPTLDRGCAGVDVSTSSVVTMNSGEVSNNTSAGWGAGFCVTNTGRLIINGGTIKNNIATAGGGGIDLNGYVELNGGTISGNSASTGGGVNVFSSSSNAVLKITNTDITDNRVTIYGGGLHIYSDSTTYYSTVTMTGGTIKNNIGTESSGAIYNSINSILNISGGNICGNTAPNYPSIFNEGEYNKTGGNVIEGSC